MTTERRKGPIPDSYWVWPGCLLAGEYPGAKSDAEAREKLRRFLEAGVTFFLDLTEEGEYHLRPYAPLVREEAATMGRSVIHRRMSIPDGQIPPPAEMTRILDAVDAALAQGHVVYIHCFGGIGRTGTVVGCFLVRHGLTGRQALDEIIRLRQGTPDGDRRSPETNWQEQMVLDWPVGG
jgi:Swiss Army Knife protein, DSP-PTPase phosphatase domain